MLNNLAMPMTQKYKMISGIDNKSCEMTSGGVIIADIILVLFGSAAIPKFAKSIGQAKKEFEKGLKEGESTKNNSKTEKE